MSLIIADNKKEFAPPPEGLQHCVCCDVFDQGVVDGPFGPQHKIQIFWQTDERDEKGRRFLIIRTYTASLNEKGKLRPMLESWRGKKFTAAELEGFDIEKLIGANCQLQIIHKLKADGAKGYDVQAVVPAPKGVPALRVEDYVRKQDRDDDKKQMETPAEESVPF